MNKKTIIIIISAVVLIAVLITAVFILSRPDVSRIFNPQTRRNPTGAEKPDLTGKIASFSSEQDFKDYLEKTISNSYYTGFGRGGAENDMKTMEGTLAPAVPSGAGETIQRISETNVQVAGIDEPDIVKTNGKEIYFSSSSYYWLGGAPTGGIMEKSLIMPPPYSGQTRIINAFPPSQLKQEAKIDDTGDLLLSSNNLTVLSGNNIYGYDVSDAKNPAKKWTIDLEDNTYIVGARLYKDKIYLVSRTGLNFYRPCPLKILSSGQDVLEIKCQDIYHPITPAYIDSTFTAMTLNPVSGKIEKNVSFVGSSGQSVVYMSENAIYITYGVEGDFMKFFHDFFKERCTDLIPARIIEKLGKLLEYDISQQSKMTEFSFILDNYRNSLSQDEALKLENELSNRILDYSKARKRDLSKTGIVKIGLEGFEFTSQGEVPGTLLNQFSLDEYQGNLRTATTVGGMWGQIGGQIESGNDVYVLDKNLQIIGSIKDLGLKEKIYSARFLGDKGYLVTFKQIDPFFVLDLFDPKNPQLKGELEIPGYSSYLHPLAENKILGIGQENWQVKMSLFDVSDASNPKEKSKYILSEGWSEVSQNHHAFLLDSKHGIFFLPAGQAGYIFSFKNDSLKLEKVVSGITAKRAVYINDYLYIIGEDKIIVLDENTWERSASLSF